MEICINWLLVRIIISLNLALASFCETAVPSGSIRITFSLALDFLPFDKVLICFGSRLTVYCEISLPCFSVKVSSTKVVFFPSVN